MKRVICGGILSAFLMTGCAGMTDTQQRVLSGAMIGTGGGAVIGAISGAPAIGAAVGAGVGAVAGLVVDNNSRNRAPKQTARKQSKSKYHKGHKPAENKETSS